MNINREPQEIVDTIILLFRGDAWLSYSSMRLVGAFSDRDALDGYLKQMKQCGELTDYDLQMLSEIDQTQGCDTNYLIKTEKINPEYEPKR